MPACSRIRRRAHLCVRAATHGPLHTVQWAPWSVVRAVLSADHPPLGSTLRTAALAYRACPRGSTRNAGALGTVLRLLSAIRCRWIRRLTVGAGRPEEAIPQRSRLVSARCSRYARSLGVSPVCNRLPHGTERVWVCASPRRECFLLV